MKHKIPRLAAAFSGLLADSDGVSTGIWRAGTGPVLSDPAPAEYVGPSGAGHDADAAFGQLQHGGGNPDDLFSGVAGDPAPMVLRSDVGGLCRGAGCGRGIGDSLYSAVE